MIPDFEDHTILETGLRDVELKICVRTSPRFPSDSVYLCLTDTRSSRRQWPGYRHLQFSRTIFLDPRRGRGVTCKGELAMKVAEAYYEFLMVSARNSLM